MKNSKFEEIWQNKIYKIEARENALPFFLFNLFESHIFIVKN